MDQHVGATTRGGPLAVGTFLAGAYLATVSGRWDEGWLIVSLVLFLLAGAAFATILDPGSAKQLDELHDRRYETVMTVLAGADSAILFLMTNKPSLVISLGVAAVGLAGAMLVAVRHERRASARPPMPQAPAV